MLEQAMEELSFRQKHQYYSVQHFLNFATLFHLAKVHGDVGSRPRQNTTCSAIDAVRTMNDWLTYFCPQIVHSRL
jgi:hypothetical protein